MIVAIHAYESTYCGLHGIESYLVMEVEGMEEAEQIAANESREVIYSCNSIIDEYEEQAKDDGIEQDSEEWDEYIEACVDDNILYEIYEITKDLKPISELEKELTADPDTFLDTHCE